jgi:hypothetical protein
MKKSKYKLTIKKRERKGKWRTPHTSGQNAHLPPTFAIAIDRRRDALINFWQAQKLCRPKGGDK